MWLNRKPCYKHLKAFGSIFYVHHDQGKLKPRALKVVFLGYPQGTMGYKVWLLNTEKCVISRDVMFQEEMVFRNLKSEEEHGIKDHFEVGQSSGTINIEITAGTSSEGQQQQPSTEDFVPGGVTMEDSSVSKDEFIDSSEEHDDDD